MITINEAFAGLYAAWRLFLRDARAVSLLDATPSGAIKSFFCAVIVLPGYMVIVALVHTHGSTEVGLFRFVMVEAIGYVIGWCVWPLLMFYVTQALDCSDRYLTYLTAFNWSYGPQIALWLIVLIVLLGGFVPKGIGVMINIAVIVVLLLYHLFIVRTTLKQPFFVSLALVIGELMVSQFVDQARAAMLR
jgi:hypothetical protein